MIRHPQLKALRWTCKAIASGQESGLWVMPTGLGKTYAFTEFARLMNQRTLVIVHREELIQQTLNHFEKQWPMASLGVIKADRNEWRRDVVVCSIQSMNPKRLVGIPGDYFGLVIVDEAHHISAPTYGRCVRHFAGRGFLLGVTATPDRLDGKGLAEWFGPEPLFSYTIRQAIEDKFLVRIRQQAVVTDTVIDDVGTVAGDFNQGQLAKEVNTEARNKTIVEAFLKNAATRRAIAFCVDVQHAHDLALEFEEAGIRSAAVHGNMAMDERRDMLERFAMGRIKVLANCEILTEGFDDPDIDCIIMARPTKSRALYTQAVGRALRLPKRNKDKVDALILDITDNCRRHKLITALSLMGAKDRNDGDTDDVLELVEQQEKEEQDHQEEIRDAIKGPVVWRLESVCPWPALPNLDHYEPSKPWHYDEPSDKQLSVIRRFGLEIQRNLTRGEASYLIDQCMAYDAAFPALATSKQEYFLRFHGVYEEGMTKKEAGRLIGEIKKTIGQS